MKIETLKTIALIMFLLRTGVCAGSFISAILLGVWLEFVEAASAFLLAIIICPAWDDYL